MLQIKVENPSAIVGLYLSFQTITNIHRQQCPPQCSHCSHRTNPSKLFSAAKFHFIQITIWNNYDEEIRFSFLSCPGREILFKNAFWPPYFFSLPIFLFFSTAVVSWSVWAVGLLLTGAQWNTSPGHACQPSQDSIFTPFFGQFLENKLVWDGITPSRRGIDMIMEQLQFRYLWLAHSLPI